VLILTIGILIIYELIIGLDVTPEIQYISVYTLASGYFILAIEYSILLTVIYSKKNLVTKTPAALSKTCPSLIFILL